MSPDFLFDGAPVVAVDPVLVSILLAPLTIVGAFVWGLLWGSFANVVIWRVPRGMSVVHPRSSCTRCDAPIAWYDNIPVVSFLLLRGRCRRCGEPLSLRYLVVELLGGFISFAFYMLCVVRPLIEGGAPALAAWLLWTTYGLGLMIVTYTDIDLWVIPNAVVLPIAALGIGAALVDPTVLGVGPVEALAAAVGGYAFVALIRWAYLRFRGIEALGLGDGKLLAMVGAFSGAAGVLWAVAAGAIQGLLIAVPMLLLGRKVAATDLQEVHGDDPELGEEDPDAGVMGMRIPFGPFLAIAALELALLRETILDALAWLVG
ncbi:MAG: prepilin peptidase [Myxococcales bacterium]|nr:prepilin peptidase [Myxococcales bacterium]